MRDYDAYFFDVDEKKKTDKLDDVRAAMETALLQLGVETARVDPKKGLIPYG
ncbi:hypothetical protein [Vibrio sp. 10N.261.54.E10]|uniref:hypothetical protein n=1 Tax=Vibrio sp. 10N.261.54.E10 TaxID=1884475 RepID=UPI0039A5EB40